MNNFCRGSKYTETKINLKRLHRCWRERNNSGKNEKWKLAAEQTCRSRAQRLCCINWKTTWSAWRNSHRANNPLENFSSEAICTFMNWRLFLANFSVVFEQNMLDAEHRWAGKMESLGLTNGEGFTGLARASICMEFPCKDKSFAEKSR